LAWAPRPRALAQPCRQPARLARGAPGQLRDLVGQRQHARLRRARAQRDRAVSGPQAASGRPRAIPHARGVGAAGEVTQPGRLTRQRTGRRGGQGDIGRRADVGLDDRRVTARRAGHEPPLAHGLGDHHARDLLNHLRPQPAHEFADRRLLRHALGQRDPAKAPQMQRVRDLADERLIAPPGALLDHHQPHQALDRDRRTPNALRDLIPRLRDRRQQRRIGQQHIQRRQIRRQLAHLDRQPHVKQRLHLTTRQTKHPPSKSPDLQGESS
jgi:hypothetical protein